MFKIVSSTKKVSVWFQGNMCLCLDALPTSGLDNTKCSRVCADRDGMLCGGSEQLSVYSRGTL